MNSSARPLTIPTISRQSVMAPEPDFGLVKVDVHSCLVYLSLTRIATCQFLSHLRAHHLVANHVPYRRDVTGRKRMLIHEGVHCGKHVGRCSGAECPHQRSLASNFVSLATRWTSSLSQSRRTGRLSQIPPAIFANVFASQGATKTMSAHRLNCWENIQITELRLTQ